MGRIKRGWALTKKSWAVLRGHPTLIKFPLYGGVATILCAAILVGPGIFFIDDGETVLGAILAVLGFFVLAVVGFYFSVGLAACADKVFRGEQPTVGDGLAVSRQRFPQVVSWAALSATVGIALSALENQGGIGVLVSRVLAIGWSLITFLAAPVIAFEGTGPWQTVKRSSGIFRARWGEQLTGNIAIGGAVGIFVTLPSVLLVIAGVAVWASAGFVGALLVIVGVIGFAIGALVSGALNGIFGVALYRYAVDGEAVGGFTAEEFDLTVMKRGGRNAPPTATPGTI